MTNKYKKFSKAKEVYFKEVTPKLSGKCASKVIYNEEDARLMAVAYYEEYKTHSRAYKCPLCNHWHLTTQVKRRK